MTKRASSDRSNDAIDQYLSDRGVSSLVRAKGLRGLVERWESIAREASHYRLTLDDWLNDLDVRDIIDGAMRVAPADDILAVGTRLSDADAAFRSATKERKHSLWGEHAGRDHDSVNQWWYFRVPLSLG